jgi:hypothetical protein
MDHCYLLCSNDKPDFKQFIKSNCDRWIELPFNPSAEMLSMYILKNVQYILDHTQKNNGEANDIKVTAVRYHETTTGWAMADQQDLVQLYLPITEGKKVRYSQGVVDDWSTELKGIMLNDLVVVNPIVEQQINL